MKKSSASRRLWLSYYFAPPSMLRRGLAERTDGVPNYVHPLSAFHMERDGRSTSAVHHILDSRYPLAGEILNFPPGVFATPGEGAGPVEVLGSPDDILEISEGDLICQATRFPLDDDPEFDKNPVCRSGLRLETKIGEVLRILLAHCSRKAVICSDAVAQRCSASELEFRAVQFNTKSDDRTGRVAGMAVRHGNAKNVSHLNQCKELPGDSTIGFITYLPTIGESGPAFLNIFGMSGTATLLWTKYVQKALSEWVLETVEGGDARLLICKFSPRFTGRTLPSQITHAAVHQPEILLDVAVPLEPTANGLSDETQLRKAGGSQ